jgi:hypothetical protein
MVNRNSNAAAAPEANKARKKQAFGEYTGRQAKHFYLLVG